MIESVGKIKSFSKASCHHYFVIFTASSLHGIFTGLLDPSLGLFVLVVVENNSSFVSNQVRICKDVFVNAAIVPYIIEKEIFNLGKKVSLVHERENQVAVTVHESFVNLFILVCACIFHSVFFFKAFKLTVSKHRKTWHCDHESADSKVFVSLSELCNCSFFIRIVHEVYIALENLRVKFDCVFYSVPVFLVFLFLEHVHEC